MNKKDSFLKVENLVVEYAAGGRITHAVNNVSFELERGKTLGLVGETGAGKSIILGAIGLLLGQRADVKAIRHGASKCVIEARFDIQSYGFQPFFAENELEYDDECILRREIQATGKSRAFINDTPVSLTLMTLTLSLVPSTRQVTAVWRPSTVTL